MKPTKRIRYSNSLPSLPSSSSTLPRPSSSYKPPPRKPQAGRSIAPSSLRPLVHASDRLTMWKTPHSISFQQQVHRILPAQVADAAFHTVEGAWAPKTKSSYAAGLLCFTQFCDEHNIPEVDRMPSSYILLVGFIAAHSGSVSGSAIKNWISGVKAWQDVNHAPWEGDDRWVTLARSSAKKSGAHHKRPQRPPVTLAHLRCLKLHLNLDTPEDAATWAIACSAFWVCRRLGELTIKATNDFSPTGSRDASKVR